MTSRRSTLEQSSKGPHNLGEGEGIGVGEGSDRPVRESGARGATNAHDATLPELHEATCQERQNMQKKSVVVDKCFRRG